MKNPARKLPVKIVCFILAAVSLCVLTAGVLCAVAFFDNGLYTKTKEKALSDTIAHSVYFDAYDIIDNCFVHDAGHYYPQKDYSPDVTNLRYRILAHDGRVVDTNTESNASLWEYSFQFHVNYNEYGTGFTFLGEAYDGDNADYLKNLYEIKLYLEEGLPITDAYSAASDIMDISYWLLYRVYPIGIAALAVALTCIILLITAAGRRSRDDELHPGPISRIPIDLILAVLLFFFTFTLECIFFTWWGDAVTTALMCGWSLLLINALLGLILTVAVRIKGGTLFKNTVIWRLCKLIVRLMQTLGRISYRLIFGIHGYWRTAILLFASVFADYVMLWLCYEWEWEVCILLCVIKNLLIIAGTVYSVWCMQRLKKSGRALASGDLKYKTDLRAMIGDFRRHGEDLNSISSGMSHAVNEQMKSERMKTELITNVSHDIKTPLTSIINYSSLIGECECQSKEHKEYAEVLVRKSEHLKRLLEDLVELSKANTGNLNVELTPCGTDVLLTQVSGEFEERCKNAGLELIVSAPERTASIMADSRRLWRVFENLMQNVCKYSMQGSRVYLNLEFDGSDAVFIFRNTSSAPLNISPDELMERFVRGDEARTAEGSGLGLSIAKSLTEIQGGSMNISIDGDLFKVTLRFPTV